MYSPHEQKVGHVQEATSDQASPEMTPRIKRSPEQTFSYQRVLPDDKERAEGNEDQRQVSKYVSETEYDQSISYPTRCLRMCNDTSPKGQPRLTQGVRPPSLLET